MTKRLSILAFWMFLVGMLDVVAATQEAIVKSFIAEVPDTVKQGEPFVLVYKLTANQWKAGSKPLQGNGFCLQKADYSKKSGSPYSELTAHATYVTSLCGNMELPGMTATVGDQVVKSAKKTVYVQPNKEYGEEMAYAHNYLVKQGKHCDSVYLSLAEGNQHFLVFEDRRNRSFCMIARKAIWPVVGLPILAYSTEAAMNNGNDRQAHQFMRNPYIKQIEALLKTKKETKVPQSYKPMNQKVGPLIGHLKWGQGEPYNRLSPTIGGKNTIVGCVPLATVMVAKYHQWPEEGRSHIYYQTNDDKIYKLDYSTFHPLWADYRNSYRTNDSLPEIDNLAKTMTFMGLSIDADFKNGVTSASIRNIKPVLTNNMGYAGKISYYQQGLSEEQIESLLYYELDHKRPCVVSCRGHAFVCDGYKDGFFHYNLGWHGSYNGYYRLKLGNYDLPKDEDNLLLIKELVTGIEPLRQHLTKEVTLAKAGTLNEVLTQEEKENLTSLKINGPINSIDIALLRKMLGALDEPPFTGWFGGSLRNLNLENATIEADKRPYLTERATGEWTHWETVGNSSRTVKYNFSTMDEKTWKNFKADIGDKKDGLYYTRKDDNTYWASYTSQKNVIGKRMFANCSSLNKIILPQNIKFIDDYAFRRCISLQEIRIPEKVKEVGKTPFQACTVLEKVSAPRAMTSKDAICDKCSPVLRKIERY